MKTIQFHKREILTAEKTFFFPSLNLIIIAILHNHQKLPGFTTLSIFEEKDFQDS